MVNLCIPYYINLFRSKLRRHQVRDRGTSLRIQIGTSLRQSTTAIYANAQTNGTPRSFLTLHWYGPGTESGVRNLDAL
jgi:hypothetical protein